MSKTIRLDDGVYIALDAIREKRETFSEVVERIIRVYATIKDVSDALGPGHFLKGAKPELKSVIGTDMSGKPLITERE